eukprot:CAMPEP_0205799340 /NCGR_PEP_ID=MMETSP0205-20121125/572_1 /ASSEMBLY_ACC=CAM_ASM_000278 /TAXON_ID=36767 /ORGANISM="Euplotes focardii, Strain TN1" /LENGTH=33 /DNA_ID= /DNA_START= /DNA_END= /DNA_ORIENTATION=
MDSGFTVIAEVRIGDMKVEFECAFLGGLKRNWE